MKTSIRLAALALSFVAAGTAFADDITIEPKSTTVSNLTRAEVVAGVVQAQADGTLLRTEADFQKIAYAPGTKSRAQVQAETLAANASGELHAASLENNSFDGRIVPAARSASLQLAGAR